MRSWHPLFFDTILDGSVLLEHRAHNFLTFQHFGLEMDTYAAPIPRMIDLEEILKVLLACLYSKLNYIRYDPKLGELVEWARYISKQVKSIVWATNHSRDIVRYILDCLA